MIEGPNGDDEPFLTVVVRTQGRRPTSLREAVESLLEQSDRDIEILVIRHLAECEQAPALPAGIDPSWGLRCIDVRGGGRSRPLNLAVDCARGTYLGFLDDDDLALPGMVAAFRAGANHSPGAVLRGVTLGQPWIADPATGEPRSAAGPPTRQFPDQFDLLEHLYDNSTPICSIALPTARVREAGLRFDDELPVLEDWHMLVRAAMKFGVVDILEDIAIYRRTDGGNSTLLVGPEQWSAVRALVVERLDDGPCILPKGTVKRLSEANFQRGGPPMSVADLERANEELEALRREHEAVLRSRSYRMLAPVRALRRRAGARWR